MSWWGSHVFQSFWWNESNTFCVGYDHSKLSPVNRPKFNALIYIEEGEEGDMAQNISPTKPFILAPACIPIQRVGVEISPRCPQRKALQDWLYIKYTHTYIYNYTYIYIHTYVSLYNS